MKIKTLKGIVSLFSLILLFVILSFPALALSKPVASTLDFNGNMEDLEVWLYVDVSFVENQVETCVINPSVNSGPDGSFSTNLGNLVFVDQPSLKCDGFWTNGDTIWYEVIIGDETFVSEQETVQSGTGLQVLLPLTINQPTTPPVPSTPAGSSSSSSSSGGGGGGGGGGSGGIVKSPYGYAEDTEDSYDGINIPSENSDDSSLEIISNLSLDNINGPTFAKLLLNFNNHNHENVTVKLLLYLLPNEENVWALEDNFIVDGSVIDNSLEQVFPLDVVDLEDGWYKLQAFFYLDDEMIAVSNYEQFFVKENVLGESYYESRLEEPTVVSERFSLGLISVFSLIIPLFIVIFVIILFVLKNKKHKSKDKDKVENKVK
jgi:hypothetical protein